MILIAPTAFKETHSASRVSQAMVRGARAASAAAVLPLPLSDGGPGLIDAMHAARGGDLLETRVQGPLGEPTVARSLRLGTTYILEAAEACGLHLVPPARRDPLRAHTFGVGQLIAWAASQGASQIVLGLGGSATVDGAAGMARALGWQLLDVAGRPLPMGALGLAELHQLVPPDHDDLPPILTLVDVRNPLLGPEGAAPAFGPQKGADARTVLQLQDGLAHLAECWRTQLGRDVAGIPGGGAAGGLGAGLVAFLEAELRSGSMWVLEAVEFDEKLELASLVVTGEGEYDRQTGWGKIVGEVIARARRHGVPVLLVAGRIREAPPSGVTAVDGGGGLLTESDIERLVREHVALAAAARAEPPG